MHKVQSNGMNNHDIGSKHVIMFTHPVGAKSRQPLQSQSLLIRRMHVVISTVQGHAEWRQRRGKHAPGTLAMRCIRNLCQLYHCSPDKSARATVSALCMCAANGLHALINYANRAYAGGSLVGIQYCGYVTGATRSNIFTFLISSISILPFPHYWRATH